MSDADTARCSLHDDKPPIVNVQVVQGGIRVAPDDPAAITALIMFEGLCRDGEPGAVRLGINPSGLPAIIGVLQQQLRAVQRRKAAAEAAAGDAGG